MVPSRDSERRDDAVSERNAPDGGDEPTPTLDGGAGIDEDELYAIVHDAVEDAVLGVVGTLLLLGVASVLVLSGITALSGATNPVATAMGALVLLAGLALAVTTLRDVLPVREWF